MDNHYIDDNDTLAWKAVNDHINGLVIKGSDLNLENTRLDFQPEGLYFNAMYGVFVPVSVYRKPKPAPVGLGPVPESAAECEFGDDEHQWRLKQEGL